MAAGFLGRVFRLGKNLLTGGLGGGTGTAPVVLVPIPGCAKVSFEATTLATVTFEPTATATVSFEPTVIATVTFEGC